MVNVRVMGLVEQETQSSLFSASNAYVHSPSVSFERHEVQKGFAATE